MIINKNSWHYRFIVWTDGGNHHIKDNLCAYFWQVVRSILQGVFGVLFAIGVGVGMLLLAGIMFAALFFSVPLGASIIAMIAWVVFGCMLFTAADEIPVPFLQKKVQGSPTINNSIVVAYIKAKHSKVCPMLTFD